MPHGLSPDELVTYDLRRPLILELQNAMNVVDGATTEWRIRRRERKTQGFKSVELAKRFLSEHPGRQPAGVTFNVQRYLTSARTRRAFRASALKMWRTAVDSA
jgi:hypothetical protein